MKIVFDRQDENKKMYKSLNENHETSIHNDGTLFNVRNCIIHITNLYNQVFYFVNSLLKKIASPIFLCEIELL